MLAHQHGLALITEKLQNQRLEEPAGGSSGVAPSTGSTTSSSFCGKLPAVSQDTFLISDHPGQTAASLSVKGKNVWTLSLEVDRTSQHGVYHHHSATAGDMSGSGNTPSLHTSSSPRSIIPSMCRHKKLRHLCQICDTAPGTPSAPPKKKHCRSLSVPPDGPSTPTFFPSGKDSSTSPCTRFSIGSGNYGSGHGHSHWSHHSHHHYHHHHHHSSSSSGHHSSNSKIWRPIAVVPLKGSALAGNVSSSGSKAGSSVKAKGGRERSNTNSGLQHHHHQYPLVNFSHTISSAEDDNANITSSSSSILTSVSGICERNNNKNNNINNLMDNNNIIGSSSTSSRISSSCSSSVLLKHKLMPPSSSSSASFDSGHSTTSDLQTPPSSPIPQPRPASAASDASYSSTGWFDFSPMRGRLNVLQNRSLSCEDRISACSSCCSSSSPFSCSSSSTSASAGTTTSMPSVYNYNSSNKNLTFGDCDSADTSSNGSRPRVGSSSGRGSASACCSHHSSGGGVGEVVPRCHSQPCVLHHRRYGKKRRRDCDRPTLNFNKMTETAYVPPHPHRRSEPWSSPSFDAQMRLWEGQGHYAFNASSGQNQQNQFYLNPIASSPLDTSELIMPRHLHQQQQNAVGGSRSTDQGGPEGSGQFLDHNMAINLTPPDTSPGSRQGLDNERKIDQNDDDDDDEEEEEDEDERNCSCHDNQQESDTIGMFQMGDLEDLDLDEIETH